VVAWGGGPDPRTLLGSYVPQFVSRKYLHDRSKLLRIGIQSEILLSFYVNRHRDKIISVYFFFRYLFSFSFVFFLKFTTSKNVRKIQNHT